MQTSKDHRLPAVPTIPEVLTMTEVDQARIMAFAFIEAARLVEERASFAEFDTPEIDASEEDKVREMMQTAVVAKMKHAGLMVLLNAANKAKPRKLRLVTDSTG